MNPLQDYSTDSFFNILIPPEPIISRPVVSLFFPIILSDASEFQNSALKLALPYLKYGSINC